MLRAQRALALAVALALAMPAAPADPPSAASLLHRLQDALGGAERIAAVTDFDQTVRGTSFDGNTGQRIGEVRKRVRWIKPSHLRLDQEGPGDTFVLYFDGTGGWEILPDGSVKDLEGGELRFARTYLRGLFLRKMLADRDPAYAISSPAANVLRITPQGDEAGRIDLTLDPGSWLPVAESSVSLADPDHPVSSETRFAQWTSVQGIRFAQRFTKFHGGAHVADAVIESTRLDSGLRIADLRAKPPDGKPVMGR